MHRCHCLLLIFPLFANLASRASDTLQARLLLDRALSQLDSARFEGALAAANQALPIFQQQKTPDDLALADCQNAIGRAWLGLKKPASALPRFQKALALRQRRLGERHPAVANCYNNLGIVFSELENPEQALVFHQKALAIRLAALGGCHPDVATSCHNLGNCHYLQSDFSKALDSYQQALAIRLDAFGENHRLVAQSCTALANCHLHGGSDPGLAVLFFEKALAAEAAVPSARNDPRLAATLARLGSLELDLGNAASARQHLLDALKIMQALPGSEHSSLASLSDKLGLTWQQEGKYDLALQYHENALALQMQTNLGQTESMTGSMYANLGACLLRKKQADEALKNYRRALAIFEKTDGRHHPLTGQCLMNMGICFFEKGETGKALAHFEQALTVLEPHSPALAAACKHHLGQAWEQRGDAVRALAFYEKSLQTLGFREGKQVDSELAGQALPALASRSGLLLKLARRSPDPSALDLARHAFDLALRALEVLRASSGSDHARQQLAEHHYPVFEGAIEMHFLLWEKTGERRCLESAFQLSERSRSFSMGLRQTNETPVSVSELQASLPDGRSALLEWFVGDSSIFAFLLTKDTLLGFCQKHDFPLREWVSAMRRGICFHFTQGAKMQAERQEEYLIHARLLFQKLLQAPLRALPPGVSRLVLLPDGALHYLPFDALLTEAPLAGASFHAYPYLLKKYALSYGLSARQWLSFRNCPRSPARHQLLAVAPDFQQDSRGLQPLRFNRREASAAVRIWGGKLLEGKEATLQRFLETAPGYAILHLATHGNADAEFGETSWLAFTETTDSLDNESLSADSLSRLRLPAELVLLSACETGIGEYRPGEGVAGLSNAFLAAGARSVLTTLWAVDDAGTAELTESFLRHLKTGLPKDLALQKARLDYLEAHPDAYGHPFFWAAFTVAGEMNAISTSGTDGLGWRLWAAMTVLVLAIFWQQQRQGIRRRN